jgi:hypothetical protein
MSTLRHGFGSGRQSNFAVLNCDGVYGQVFRSVEPAAAAEIVPAAVPTAAKLRALQSAELQGKWALAALVGHGEEFAVDVDE